MGIIAERNIGVGKKKIGGSSPCFIIAEIGINHNNDISTAKRMIDSSAEAGCDAVKLQAFRTESLYSRKAGKLDWIDGKKRYSYDIFKGNKKYELPPTWIPPLKDYCASRGILLISSVFDEASADYLDTQGIPCFKLASTSLTNIPLLEYVAKKGKPVMISIGAASHDEVKEAVATLSSFTDKLVLMHCHLKYPTEPKQANLAVITTLKKQFPVAIIGYSDHTEHPYDAPVAAVSLGAKVLEKHITLDKTMEGPDHFFALDPGELKLMVEKVREAEEKIRHGNSVGIKNVLLGSPEIRTHEDEGYLRNFAYQTILSIKRIPGGERLTRENIRILRPGNIPWGIEPKHYPSLIKKNYIAQRDIDEGESIHWSDLIEK